MRKLRFTGSAATISRSSSVDAIAQLQDQVRIIQSTLSQIVTTVNESVQPVLDSLPQGRSDTRWNLTDDNIFPQKQGLDATQIFVDNDATSSADGGRYWRSDYSRPKTIKETLSSIYLELLTQVDQARLEFVSSSGATLSDRAVGLIGANVFDASQTSSSSSLQGLTSSNMIHLLQIARDLYDDSYDSWTADGSALLDIKSVRDMVESLMELHNSDWNSPVSPTHEDIQSAESSYKLFFGGAGETDLTSDLVIGGLCFTPALDSLATISFISEAGIVRTYTGAGSYPSYASISLYDMGAPGSIETPRLVTELTTALLDIGTIDKVEAELDVVSSTPGTDEIFNTERVYEIRIKVGGTPATGDVAKTLWTGIEIEI